MNRLNIALASVLLALPLAATAQVLKIEPSIVDSSSPVEDALRENKGRASTAISGNGGILSIEYSSNEPIEIYMAPLDRDGHFVRTDFLRFTLPSTENGSVEVDIMKSPGWRPFEQRWALHLLSKDKTTEAGFTKLAFVRVSPVATLGAAIRHFMTPEPYTPSSYHMLLGYRVMGIDVTMVIGLLTLAGACIVLVIAKKPAKLPALVTLLLIVSGLYQLRFSVDLLRFTGEHLEGYANGVYDEAGSVYQIAGLLKSLEKSMNRTGPDTVYVCRDGTNYKEKILRYMSYPIRISSDEADAVKADFAVVMDKGDWSLATATKEGQTYQTLRCGALSRDAVKVTEFPDGSILFSLRHP